MKDTQDSPVGRRGFLIGAGGVTVSGLAVLAGCNDNKSSSGTATSIPQDALGVAKARGLKDADVTASLKTYTPAGKLDTHYMFTSGGHSGQVWVVGLPSMRYLKVIPVFNDSPYQGWGFTDDSKKVLAGGSIAGKTQTWGDTHHTALSEENGEYDGKHLFINDKASSRIAVIDLTDFRTKQIVKNPLTMGDHGCAITPNSEYLVETSQYVTPLGYKYAPMTQDSFNKNYRGVAMFWKFDSDKGKIDEANSFAMELPPYCQDLADAGKLASDGWAFCNCYNSERAIVGTGTPLEKSASANDMDFLHVMNWKGAEQVVKAGKATKVNGVNFIPFATSIKEGLLYLIPEPKSPHGCDVTPNGEYIVVCGKLDPHVTVYSFKKIQDAIKAGKFTKDPYGVPIIDYKSVLEAQVEVGLGPLHTQFDNDGNAYTSLFIDSSVTKWSLGGSYRSDGWKVVSKVQVNYNVGHVAAAAGDTTKPEGNYLVALNKWALNEFLPSGPHYTTNQQLIDISQASSMQVIAQAPCPDGEPHYAQIINASKIQPLKVYPGNYNAEASAKDPNAVEAGKERIVRSGTKVEVFMTVMRSHITPDLVEVNEGDTVVFHVTNIEQAQNASHGFAVPVFGVSTVINPGETQNITIKADTSGVFPYYCTEFCSALHLEMMGYFLVKPRG